MIHVELITPERLALSDTVEFIAAPSTLGELGVLPGHAPLLAQLAPGEIRLKKDGVTRFVAVTGGFIEIQKGSRVAIFAESAEFSEEIDVERARLAAERAKAKLVEPGLKGMELAEVEAALNRARLRLKVGEIRRRRGGSASTQH